MTVGDFTNDGRLDVAFGVTNGSVVGLLQGNGDGPFGSPTFYGAGPSPLFLTSGDFNNDGYRDVAAAVSGALDVTVLYGVPNIYDTYVMAAPQQTAPGVPFNLTITALSPTLGQDVNYTGTVHFSSTDSSAGLPTDYTFTSADQGKHTFTVGAVDTTYTGTDHFSSSDSQAGLPADFVFLFADHGKHTFNVTLKTAGLDSVMIAYVLSSISGQAQVQVAPAAAASFAVSADAYQTQGVPISVTVNAYDAHGNVAAGYRGKVHLTSSDPHARLPADYTFKASDNGTHTFQVTLAALGYQTLTVTDKADGTVNGVKSFIISEAPPRRDEHWQRGRF